MTGAATILLLAIPFVPGLRDIPRLVPVHRLIWRSWYRRASSAGSGSAPAETAGPAIDGSPPGVDGSPAPEEHLV